MAHLIFYRSAFLAAHIPLFLYPFLHTVSKTRPFEYLRLTSLGVIGKICLSSVESLGDLGECVEHWKGPVFLQACLIYNISLIKGNNTIIWFLSTIRKKAKVFWLKHFQNMTLFWPILLWWCVNNDHVFTKSKSVNPKLYWFFISPWQSVTSKDVTFDISRFSHILYLVAFLK